MAANSTISVLPGDCLRIIFLHLPILERVKLRQVCKTWRDVCDDCWREAKSIDVSTCTTIYDGSGRIMLRIQKTSVAAAVIRLCAPYIRKFSSCNAASDILLQSLEESCNIEHLHLDFHSRTQDKQLGEILKANCLKYLSIKVSRDQTCLRQLFTDCLETLIIQIELEQASDCHFDEQFRQILQNITDNAKILRRLYLMDINGRSCPDFTSCANLLDLTISQSRFEWTAPTGNDVSETAVSSITKLSKLQKLSLSHFPDNRINDQFLIDLSRNCVELQNITLLPCYEVTDKGIKALSIFPHLRCLTMFYVQQVTNNSLIHLKNLEQLTMEYTRLTNEDVVELLCECSSLQYLNLYAGNFDVNDVRLISEMLKYRDSSTLLDLIIEGQWIVYEGVMVSHFSLATFMS